MKIKDFVSSEFNYIFNSNCIIYKPDGETYKEIKITDETEDSEIVSLYDYEIDEILPCIYKNETKVDNDERLCEANIGIELGFAIYLKELETSNEAS